MTVIGVFCARVRVEEKQIIGAFGDAGVVAMPVLPANSPMPPGPTTRPAPPATSDGLLDINDQTLTTVIDRCANRYVAAATVPLLQARGISVVSSGLAATGSRLDVAAALERAGIARPSTLLAFTEESANQAVRQIGVPAALFSLNSGKSWTPMQDLDTADAVVEHRMVLGGDAHAVVLVQAGAPTAADITTIHLVAGKAIACDGELPDAAMVALAVSAANVLEATLVSVQLATISGRLVVWDVLPAADFRSSRLLGPVTMAEAIVASVLGVSNDVEVRRGVNGISLNS
ncbi:MAG: hypothetical protein WKF81_01870 [Thermomicrobiales bacterium]